MSEDKKTKSEINEEFVKQICFMNDEIKTIQEAKKNLKDDYKKNNLLTSAEIKLLERAIAAINSEVDIDKFAEAFNSAVEVMGKPS